jgi:hypothetical protein
VKRADLGGLPLAFGASMRKQPAQIVTNKRSPVVHVSTEVPRPLGEAFEEIARAKGKSRTSSQAHSDFGRDTENGENGALTFPSSSAPFGLCSAP